MIFVSKIKANFGIQMGEKTTHFFLGLISLRKYAFDWPCLFFLVSICSNHVVWELKLTAENCLFFLSLMIKWNGGCCLGNGIPSLTCILKKLLHNHFRIWLGCFQFRKLVFLHLTVNQSELAQAIYDAQFTILCKLLLG